MSEKTEQIAIFRQCEKLSIKYNELKLLFAIPNAQKLVGRARNKIAFLASQKREGLKPGVPDMFLPVPRGKYHGLFIELKDIGKGNNTSNSQDDWLEALEQQGYLTAVCEGSDKALDLIIDYLKLSENQQIN